MVVMPFGDGLASSAACVVLRVDVWSPAVEFGIRSDCKSNDSSYVVAFGSSDTLRPLLVARLSTTALPSAPVM